MAAENKISTYTAAEVAELIRPLADSVELLQKENAELKRKLEHMNEVFANVQRVRFGQSRGKNSFVDARGSILTSRIFVAFHTKL